VSKVKSKKAAVYFSAGIGDALLLTPLIKLLKEEGYTITGVFTSKFNIHQLYDHIELLDNRQILLNKHQQIRFIVSNLFKRIDISFLNYFAYNRRNVLIAAFTSLKIHTNNYAVLQSIFIKKSSFIKPLKFLHDAEQNLLLNSEKHKIHENDFHVQLKKENIHFILPEKFIAVQLGAGNNSTPYKILDTEKWKMILQKICADFPNYQIVLLGDRYETELHNAINNHNYLNLCGKTNLKDLPLILKEASCFIGGDSGLMHLSAAINLPTFTVWGASSEINYSYNKFNPIKHQIYFQQHLKCRPCSSWINPNTSRINNADNCPDFICLKQIDANDIYEKLNVFLNHHLAEC